MGFFAVLCRPQTVQAGDKGSRWVSKPIVADGNNSEWPQPYPYKEDENTRIQYAIANDGQMLYLTLKTSDDATKMKLRVNGLTISVDTTGKKLNNTSFYFATQTRPPADTGQALNINELQVQGTAGYDGSYRLAGNKPGIAAAGLSNDMGELVVEIAIPFKCIYPAVADHISGRYKLGIGISLWGLSNEHIDALQHPAKDTMSNAMAMPAVNSNGTGAMQGDEAGRGAPTRGANGAMGIGIGGGKGKGDHSGPASAPEIDANAMMMDHQRAAQDNEIWKVVRLGFEG